MNIILDKTIISVNFNREYPTDNLFPGNFGTMLLLVCIPILAGARYKMKQFQNHSKDETVRAAIGRSF